MPELPEVETVRRTLELRIIGEEIIDVKVLCERIIGNIASTDFINALKGEKITKLHRYGKYLIFIFEHVSIISHLRMEGKYFIKEATEPIVKHEHIIFTFKSGLSLRYHDTRKFGTMKLVKTTNLDEILNEPEIKKLGKEANDETFTKDELYERLIRLKAPLKQSLLDQTNICGLGNIYVDEVNYLCNLNPTMRSSYVTKEDCENILKSSREVLQKAIDAGGTTIRSYTSSLGVTGRFQLSLYVHTLVGNPCQRCQSIIEKITVGGRGTYLCPKCQKARPYVVGITGSIASGKSAVSKYLIKQGFKVIDTDIIARMVIENDQVIKQIKENFGTEVFTNNLIDRKKLANVIFTNQTKKEILNKIMHPLIKEEVKKQINECSNQMIFIDVPLMFEAKFDEICNKVICVNISKEEQIKRLINRDNIDSIKAEERISSQMPLSDKCKKSHYIIDNSRDLCYTYKQIDNVLLKIKKEI